MQQFDLYKDIAERTGGDIYIGVVGLPNLRSSTTSRTNTAANASQTSCRNRRTERRL